MGPTHYDIEKLMRLVHDQKLADSMERIAIEQRKAQKRMSLPEQVPYQVRPSGVAAG